MNKKRVLIISSSPRHGGNSDVLCDQFQKGAVAAGHDVQRVNLREINLHYCIDCRHCTKDGTCVFKDGMDAILAQMINCDVMVLATPVYFYSMSSQLKTLIDRTVARWTEIKNKEVYILLAAADEDAANLYSTLEAVRGFTRDCLENCAEKGIILANNCHQINDVAQHPSYLEALEMGRKI